MGPADGLAASTTSLMASAIRVPNSVTHWVGLLCGQYGFPPVGTPAFCGLAYWGPNAARIFLFRSSLFAGRDEIFTSMAGTSNFIGCTVIDDGVAHSVSARAST